LRFQTNLFGLLQSKNRGIDSGVGAIQKSLVILLHMGKSMHCGVAGTLF